MSPSQIHEDMTATLGDPCKSYGIVKRWCREFKCGRTSCENEHGSRHVTVTTPENINKVQLCSKRMSRVLMRIQLYAGRRVRTTVRN
ncbi:hypothetical protein C0J52_23548 [Blattella germanica]|nr:hypothetical protein C0J52_23548 [Blattella germanica]